MKTIQLTINLRDGQKVVAVASARSVGDEVPVQYFGNSSALEPICDKGSLRFVEWFLRARAGQLGAIVQLNTEGEYHNGGLGAKHNGKPGTKTAETKGPQASTRIREKPRKSSLPKK